MKLLIVESPGKVKKIQDFLGYDWKVAASIGHVRDLPKNEIAVYPPNFIPRYEETDRGKQIISDLKRLVAKADSVYLATDPDREGEAIAWHLKEALNLKDHYRVTYTEITEKAVKKGVENPGKINLNLVQAQEGRRVLDRLFGYTVSPLLRDITGKNLSAGRVQSPALRLVVEKEALIKKFKSTTHFGVEFIFDQTDNSWKAVWNTKNWLKTDQEYLEDKSIAEQIATLRNFTVDSYQEGQSNQAPPPPFITSTLQQAASNALKFDPKQTMSVAQRLYEEGHITYMRTDSFNLSEEAIDDIRNLAQKNGWPLPPTPRTWKSKDGAQEAHEAIRPTHVKIENAGETDQERALYRLIRLRTLACQLEEAIYATVKAFLKSDLNGKEVILEAKGRRLLSPGWKVVVTEDQAEDSKKDQDELNNPVPKLQEGAPISATRSDLKTKKTSPPTRYTLASLIRELEKKGIGRPSTYAAIMDNITSRGYILQNKKRQLEATSTGEQLIAYLSTRFEFLEFDYTRNLETKLDEIAEGKSRYLAVVKEANDNLLIETESFMTAHLQTCPICQKPLRHWVKEGEDGYNFWSCTDRDKCGSKFRDDHGQPGEKTQSIVSSDYTCETCGNPLRHIIKDGPNGYNFWGCSNRSCNSTYQNNGDKPGTINIKKPKEEPSKFKCQVCNMPLYHRIGHSEKTGRDYDFWSCSDRQCNKTYQTKDDQPDFGPEQVPSKKEPNSYHRD